MAAPRKTRKYQVRVERKIVHGGKTKRPLEERLKEHQEKWPNATIKQVGRATTAKAASEWEKEKGYS